MKGMVALLNAVMLCAFSTTALADIYQWTDEDGVKHYSNFAPPDQAETLIKSEELPYTGMSDEELRAAERAQNLADAQREMAERKVEILEKQLAAERRMEAAEERAADMIQEAESLLEKAEEKYQNAYKYRYLYYGYYPFYKYWRHGKKHITHDRAYYGRRHHSKVKAVPYAGSKPRRAQEMRSAGHGRSRGLKGGAGRKQRSPLGSRHRSGGHQMRGRSSISLRLR